MILILKKSEPEESEASMLLNINSIEALMTRDKEHPIHKNQTELYRRGISDAFVIDLPKDEVIRILRDHINRCAEKQNVEVLCMFCHQGEVVKKNDKHFCVKCGIEQLGDD